MAADREAIYAALPPEVLPRLTPLLRTIETDGDLWRWELTGSTSSASGSRRASPSGWPSTRPTASPTPTPRPRAQHEPAGAEGWYELTEVGRRHPPADQPDHVRRPPPLQGRPSGGDPGDELDG